MKSALILFCLLATVTCAVAQNADSAKYKAGWGDLNYAVPESPAFKILGTSSSDIMRPATVKNVAVSVGNSLLGSKGSIPQNMAIELAPAILKPNVNLYEFQRNPIWYTSSFSIGTKVNADKSYAIGLGIKVRLIDKADLRLDKSFIAVLDQYANTSVITYSQAIQQVTREYYMADKQKNGVAAKPFPVWRQIVADAYANPKTQSDSIIFKQVTAIYSKAFDPQGISEYRDSIKKNNWNKLVWDMGIGALFNSKDSLLKDIRPASKIGLWTTIGLPFAGTKGQLLIGLTGQLRDTVNSRFGIAMLNIGARAYYGSNDLKGFLEGNTLLQSYQAGTFKGNIGIETTFVGGLWVDFTLGVTKQGSAKAAFTPGFSVFFGNGEKKTKSGS